MIQNIATAANETIAVKTSLRDPKNESAAKQNYIRSVAEKRVHVAVSKHSIWKKPALSSSNCKTRKTMKNNSFT